MFSVASMKKPVSFLLQVQNSPWEVQVRILPLVQRANQRRTRRTLHVTGVIKRDIKYKEELEEKKKMDTPAQEKGKAAAVITVTADSECSTEW